MQDMVDSLLRNDFGSYIWKSNLKQMDRSKMYSNVKSPFWNDVLCYANDYFSVSITSKEQVLEQVLWYNSSIRIDNKIIAFPNWIRNKIFTMQDIWNLETN